MSSFRKARSSRMSNEIDNQLNELNVFEQPKALTKSDLEAEEELNEEGSRRISYIEKFNQFNLPSKSSGNSDRLSYTEENKSSSDNDSFE